MSLPRKNNLSLHSDLLETKKLYGKSDLVCKDIKLELESQEYGASEFTLNQWRIKFRVAKITPMKIGQFVTLWKRQGNGPILPYEIEDPFDFYIFSVRDKTHFGQFIFLKKVLYEKGILADCGRGGKRALRGCFKTNSSSIFGILFP